LLDNFKNVDLVVELADADLVDAIFLGHPSATSARADSTASALPASARPTAQPVEVAFDLRPQRSHVVVAEDMPRLDRILDSGLLVRKVVEA